MIGRFQGSWKGCLNVALGHKPNKPLGFNGERKREGLPGVKWAEYRGTRSTQPREAQPLLSIDRIGDLPNGARDSEHHA
jgi:hypothetical protein